MRPRIRSAASLTLVLLAAVVSAALPAQEPPPSRSGEVLEVTTVIQCFCGTCTNQTLHDCTCGVAAGERDRVAAAIAAGASPDEIIASYVDQHGAQVRIVPERKGLALIGYAVPFAASIAALIILLIVLKAWKRPRLRAATGPATGSDPADARYLERLNAELRELD